jgi:hypothetical protein
MLKHISVRKQFVLKCEWKINTNLKAVKNIPKQQPTASKQKCGFHSIFLPATKHFIYFHLI